MAIRNRFKPPSFEHPLGTDNLGRSQLSRIVYGARLSLAIGFAVVILNAVFGVMLGAAAGYFRRLDNMLMRMTDALMAFPAVLLAIAIAAALGRVEPDRRHRAVGGLHSAHRPHRACLGAGGSGNGVRAGRHGDGRRAIGASCASTSCPTAWLR